MILLFEIGVYIFGVFGFVQGLHYWFLGSVESRCLFEEGVSQVWGESGVRKFQVYEGFGYGSASGY